MALVFHKNMPVIPTKLIRYHDAEDYAGLVGGHSKGLGLGAVARAAAILFRVFRGGGHGRAGGGATAAAGSRLSLSGRSLRPRRGRDCYPDAAGFAAAGALAMTGALPAGFGGFSTRSKRWVKHCGR